ncbi:hypothetical protein BDV96DRAFT_651379 [Lophiotrema nucula]|uniref:Arginase/deacetylase n=1 Tax=Lophiotrema nucula TaxID=690887 RepID=A0A6A5YSR5_9PLEO|nr:hypothetical protein BDV96DRAFT_651379 [Lophiotrema nucula]
MAPSSKVINLVNVPSDIGSIYAGKSRAPAAFADAGLQEKLKDGGFEVNEFQAFENAMPAGWVASTREPNGAKNETKTVEACQQVRDTVAAALKHNQKGEIERPDFQVILAGECLYCPAILSSYWGHFKGEKRIGLIYIDADCDLYAPVEPNGSGNIAGMTLTHLTLREGALESMKTFARPDGSGVVSNDNIVLFGTNMQSGTNKREHLAYLFDNDYRVFTSQTVQRMPTETGTAALEWMEERVDYILVHLDVDVIDPDTFPLCNVPSYTGLGFEQCMAALRVLLKSDKCVALSVAEVNPDHDPGLLMTGRLVNELVGALG